MKNSFLVIMLLLSVACSKSPGKTTSKLKIVSGNFSAILSSKANNGLLLYGKSSDGKSFTKKIDSDTTDLVFPNGSWNFYAVSWEYASPGALPDFKGKTYCGKTSAVFNGTDTTIQIDLTNPGCNDPAFSANVHYMSEYRLPQPNFINCKDISGITNTSSCDQNPAAHLNKGYATSYKIVAFEYKNFADVTAPVKVAESACFRTDYSALTGITAGTDSSALGLIHLPTTMGNGLSLSVQVFYSGGATPGTYAPCDPSNGVDLVPISESPRTKLIVDNAPSMSAIYNLYIKSDAADVCSGARLAPGVPAAGFGTVGSPYAICSRGQFDYFSSNFSSYNTTSIDLLTDIDYGMNPITPLGSALAPAGGNNSLSYGVGSKVVFDGHNHKISNFLINCKSPGGTVANNQVGFFRSLYDAEIRNITFNDGVLMCDGGNEIGIVAGQVNNTGATGSIFKNVKVHGHGEGNDKVGGLAGSIVNGMATLENVHVRGDLNGAHYVGGIVGYMNMVNSSSIIKTSFHGGISANKNGGGTVEQSWAGGLAGWAKISAGNITIDQAIVQSERIEGSTVVGGLVGETDHVNITNSYTEAILRASGNSDGTTTHASIGGAVGLASNTSLAHVLALNTIKSSNRTATTDHSFGGMIGSQVTAPVCSASYYNDVADSTVSCGTALSYSTSRTSSSYIGQGFNFVTKMADWDVATSPGSYGTTCSPSLAGQYHEIISMGAMTNFPGTSNVGDILLCDGSTNTIVPLLSVYSTLTSPPFLWSFPDDGFDTPRLSFEEAIENDVHYFKRDCHGHFTTQVGSGATPVDPKWICSYDQFNVMDTTSYYALKKNIYADSGVHTPMAPGSYKLDGNNYGLIGFTMNLPATFTADTNIGIFSQLTVGSLINNIFVIGADISGISTTSGNPLVQIGVLAGSNEGTILNSEISNSKISARVNAVSGDSVYIGGGVGNNIGTIKKTRIDVQTTIDQGTFPAGSVLKAGGAVGKNIGSIVGVRSSSSLNRLSYCASSETLSLSTNEILGGFIAFNSGSISEVEAQGDFWADIQSGGCVYAPSGNHSSFIVENSGVVQDFTISAREYLRGAPPALSYKFITNNTSNNVRRGIIKLEAQQSFAFLPYQSFAFGGVNWNPASYPYSGGGAPSATCLLSGTGTYIDVTSAASSANVLTIPLVASDRVICNGSRYVVLSLADFTTLDSESPTNSSYLMSEILYTVKNPGGYCTNPAYFSSADCVAASSTWNAGTSASLPVGRYYDDQLFYSLGAPGLVVEDGSHSSIFTSTAWITGSDFFNPGTNVWNLDLPNAAVYSSKPPELVKTGGSLDEIGLPF
jgi:hypothetical protein